jgi:iron complex outermembrane receptor protein
MRPILVRPRLSFVLSVSIASTPLTMAAPASALAATAASPAAAETSVISGRVLTGDGQPVAGAHVRIVELGRHADAGPDGAYRFEGVPRGSYLIEAKSDRFGAQVARVDATSSATVAADVVLSVAFHKEAVIVNSGLEASAIGESARPISVVADLDLAVRLKSTLGETLAEQPGVASTSFGPGASRPVIRGLGGDRVRILQGGVGMADASNTSPDHAVSFDPLSAEQIEVLRGPATLLYGSTAIGGVVNVIDGRIPETVPDKPVGGVFDLALGSVSREKQGGASLHGGGGKFAWHLDGLRRETDDVRIPTSEGRLTNSATENTSGSAGVSVVGTRAFLGASVSMFDTTYGIPSEEDVNIDLQQRRLDLKGGIREPFGAFRGAKFRFGVSNYEHAELEGTEIGTKFENDAYEGRLELLHKDAGPFQGAFGFQAHSRDLTVTGEEAFLPPSGTKSFAGFILEEAGKGRARLALGARVEHQKVSVVDGDSRSMTGVSGSLGLSVRGDNGFTFGLSLAHSERLPGAEELFSDGPHAATNAFEVGDPGLAKEKSLGLDASVRKTGGRVNAELSFFRNAFDGYIFERFTDEEEDGLRVVRYEQRDARFWGFESQVSLSLLESGGRHFGLDLSADYVRAAIDPTDEPLPRISPMRLGAGFHYRDSRFDVRAEARRTATQDRVSALETETPGHTFVNATASYRIFGGTGTVTDLLVRATNMANTLGRNHVSYLKDLAPLPGRDIRASVRFRF